MWNELDVVRDVSHRLDAAGLEFMLTGSMAMNFYAQPRMTRDIENFTTWIVSKEDLIISKLDWAKDTRSTQQFGDIRNLLSTDCDTSYIEKWTETLGLGNLWSEIQS